MLKNIFCAVVFLVMLLMGIYIVYNPEMGSSVSDLTNQFTDKKNTVQEKIAQKTEISKEDIVADIVKFTKGNMQTFALSVKKKDMSAFYNNLSEYWQKRTSPKSLNKDFETFIKRGIDLTTLNIMQPILDKGTKIDERGNLHVVGHYNTKPLTLHFKQTGQFQHPEGWKLVAFSVEIK